MSTKGLHRRVALPNEKDAYAQMKAVADALEHLRSAGLVLRAQQCAPNARRRIRLALRSAEGAYRHAVGLYVRARETA